MKMRNATRIPTPFRTNRIVKILHGHQPSQDATLGFGQHPLQHRAVRSSCSSKPPMLYSKGWSGSPLVASVP